MFNSPLHRCPVCNEHVALDQSQQECAREHRCEAKHCPLAHLFASQKLSPSDAPTQTPQAKAKPTAQ